MTKKTDFEKEVEANIFGNDLEELLTTIQKMTQSKDVEYTKGDLMEFFANITVNLIINSGVCHECFQTMLAELFDAAEENNLLISHDTAPGHLH